MSSPIQNTVESESVLSLNIALNPFGRGRKWGAVYEAVKRSIMLQELPPGGSLSELALARQFNCSQGVIREALLHLQEDGLVNRSGYRGTSVSQTDPEEAEEMVLLRCSIEARGIRRVISRLDERDLAALSELIDQMEETAKTGDAYALFQIDCAFHLGLFRMAQLPALEPVLSRCLLHNNRAKMASNERRTLDWIARRHRRIHEALAARDTELAVEIINRHIKTIIEPEMYGHD